MHSVAAAADTVPATQGVQVVAPPEDIVPPGHAQHAPVHVVEGLEIGVGVGDGGCGVGGWEVWVGVWGFGVGGWGLGSGGWGLGCGVWGLGFGIWG